MKNFQDAVAAIAQALPLWEQTELTKKQIEALNAVQKNLNEAQTCQAVILRLLDAAGYDIWNPFEVFPEKNSGKDIPDFTIFFEDKARFVIEAKFLGKELIDNDKNQAIGYASRFGLRWVILTNGKQWTFLDNNVVEKIPVEKVVLVLNLFEPCEGEFLGILLDRQLWEKDGANERVAEKLQLIKITQELRSFLLRDTAFPHDERGVKLAIRYELAADKKVFAEQHLTTILALLFPQNTPLVETPTAPITQITPQATEEPLNVWQVLYEQLEAAQQKSRTDISKMKDFYTIRFDKYQINISSLGNLCEAFGETCLKLKLSEALKLVSEQDRNPAMAYRLLSNQQYISVNYSFDAGIAFVKKLLKTLGLPAGSVTISSNNRGIHELP